MSNSDTQLMVIHNGSPLKVCRNESSASQLYQETPKTKKMRQTFRFFSSIIIGSALIGVSFIFDQHNQQDFDLNQVVGYVEVSPGVCESTFMGEDNEFYIIQEECNK